MTHTSNSQQLPHGQWLLALREGLTKDATAKLAATPSQEAKMVVMEELVEKLKAIQEYDLSLIHI